MSSLREHAHRLNLLFRIHRQFTMKKLSILLTTWLLCTLGLSGCTDLVNKDLINSSLIYCSEGSPETFNPQLVTSGTTIDALSNTLYNRLAQIDEQTGEVVPELAESWETSEDGLVYTFHLRKGVHFHTTEYFTPTRTMNADDVLFSFNRILNPTHPYHSISNGTYHFFRSVELDRIVQVVEKLDDYTVRFKLIHPDSSLLSNLATDFAIVLSKEYADQLAAEGNKQQIDNLPVGTGPFSYRQFQRDVLIRFYAHPKYWKKDIKISQLVFDITPNNSSRMAKLISHECDVIAYPVSSQISLLEEKPDIDVDQETVLNVGFWAFNTDKEPFDNVLVRRALAHAINKRAILKSVFFDHATEAASVLPPTSWAYDPNLAKADYNPHLAKKLLTEAGYPNGFDMDIWALPIQRVYNPNALKMSELMQVDLARIGVNARIVSYEWATFRRALSNSEHDTVLIGWTADNADPDNFFRPLLSCSSAISGANRTNWCNMEFDELLKSALTTPDTKKRKRFYRQAQAILIDEAPLVPIAHSLKFQAKLRNVKGVGVNPYGAISFEDASRGN